jgi:aryl-alcohol dehydrogenase-like predicted oxidoreductase
MAGLYGPVPELRAHATVRRALDLGITLFDTADAYGPFTNETFLRDALGQDRRGVIVATKVGRRVGGGRPGLDGRPEHVRAACEGSLKRLDAEAIDLYTLHRVDPTVPVEETVGAMSELVAAGKVRRIGLSEVSAATIRRAHAVHPLASVQSEYSLWSRDVESEVLPTLRELGIALLAYSPLGRGFLTGSGSCGRHGRARRAIAVPSVPADLRAREPRARGTAGVRGGPGRRDPRRSWRSHGSSHRGTTSFRS